MKTESGMPSAEPRGASRNVPGSHGCHEALHLAYVFGDMVEKHLLEHDAVQADPAFKELAERATTALYDLYQAIGAKHIDATPPSPKLRKLMNEPAPWEPFTPATGD